MTFIILAKQRSSNTFSAEVFLHCKCNMKSMLDRCIQSISFVFVLAQSLTNAPAQTTQDSPGSCTGLCAQQTNCPGGGYTSVSGTVYAPNGTDPIYNALVYVPNGTVQAFSAGVHCGQCGSEVSGDPLISTLTGADGTFLLQNVPVGTNIPLVIQIGRWRRVTSIPLVAACSNTPLANSQTRLPMRQGEFSPLDNIPLMAFVTTQVDETECLLRKIGMSDTEFSNPASAGGNGRIRFYKDPNAAGATISANTPSATNLWSQSEINQYDLVFMPDPGAQYTQTAAHQQILINYVNAGGRVFTSHFSYTWLYNDAPFSGTATWHVNQISPASPQTAYINTNFSRGLALAKWLKTVGASTTFGQITLSNLRHDFDGVVAPSLLWSSLGAPPTGAFTVPIQYTFDAPVGTPPTSQCGRLFYIEALPDLPASSTAGLTFPAECNTMIMTAPEKLIEFAIFDLCSCIDPSLSVTSVTASSNQFIISGQGAPSYPATIQVSPDLRTAFTNFGNATADTNGHFQFKDTNTLSRKFYRGTYP